jgi:hypothetical protein
MNNMDAIIEEAILKKNFEKLVNIALNEEREYAERAVDGIPIEEQESLIKIADFEGHGLGGYEFYITRKRALCKVTNQDILKKHYPTNPFSVADLIEDIEFLKSICGSVSDEEQEETEFVIEQKEKNPNHIKETIEHIKENYQKLIDELKEQ